MLKAPHKDKLEAALTNPKCSEADKKNFEKRSRTIFHLDCQNERSKIERKTAS